MCSLKCDLIVFNYAYHHPRVLCDKNATWMFNIKKERKPNLLVQLTLFCLI